MANPKSTMKKHSFKSIKNMKSSSNVGFSLNGDADRAPPPSGGQVPEEDASIPTTTTQHGLGEEHEKGTNQKPVQVFREGLKVTDVILGRSNETGIYAATIKAWWPYYESASHSGKRRVCRAVIEELCQKGVRFLNKVIDETRHGHYTVEPPSSVTVERKILRGLRLEVRKHEKDKAVFVPPQYTASARFQVVGAKATRGKTGDGKKAVVKKGRPAKRSKVDKVQQVQQTNDIPILPTPSSEYFKFPLLFLAPPPLRTDPTPPILQVASSSGSIGGDHRQSVQLIPSALNWSTSDLKGANIPPSKPHAATSPDTVMLSVNDDEQTPTPGPSKPLLQVRSSISYDLTKIFDDVIDPVSGDITTTSNQNKECPPLLTGNQSSMFSMVHFTDWQQEVGQEGHPLKNIIKPSTSTMNRRLSLIDDDLPPPTEAVASYIGMAPDDPMIPSTPRLNDHLDRNSFFGGDEVAALISPTLAPPLNFGKPKSPTTDLTMPRITPQDEDRYHRRSSSMDSIEDPIPMQQAASHHTIANHENDQYRALCRRLEVSMARLESEELEHRSWEAHNEALWRHFIQEQPDLAKLLQSRMRDEKVSAKGAPNLQVPEGRSSPGAATFNSLRDDFQNMESWKWPSQSFGADLDEELWEAV